MKASLVQTGDAVLIQLPSGVGWRMQAAGGALKLEESVYLGRSGEAKHSEQVVVTGASGSDVTVREMGIAPHRHLMRGSHG